MTIENTAATPRDTLDAVRRYTRFAVLAELNMAFVRSGMTIEQVAVRLGWRPVQVRKFLSGRTKIPLDKISATAFAIDGSLVKFSFTPL